MQDGTPVDSDAPVTGEEPAVPGTMPSVASTLQGLRGQLGKNATPLDLDVPGYDGILVIRYKWVPFSEISKNSEVLKRIGNQSALAVAACCETLISTCVEFLIRAEDGELHPLSQDDVPITFLDKRLAEALGFDASLGSRDYVRSTFSNDYALIETANTVMEWLQDTSKGVNKDFLGG
jgi:hypothetical protein